jgi:hypothetical protein
MKTTKKIILSLVLLFSFFGFSASLVSAAEPCGDSCAGTGGPSGSTGTTSSTPVDPNVNCNNTSPSGLQSCLKSNKIVEDLNGIIDFLSAGVAIVVIGSMILGGIQ